VSTVKEKHWKYTED